MARSIVVSAMAFSDQRTITVDAAMLYSSEWKPLVEANIKLLLELHLDEELEDRDDKDIQTLMDVNKETNFWFIGGRDKFISVCFDGDWE